MNEPPYAFKGLDRVLHEKARLGILSSLIANPDGLTFSSLKQLCGLTDGNLSRHLQVLEDERLIRVAKTFVRKRPHTTCHLTDVGRQRFLAYLELLEAIVKEAAKAADGAGSQQPGTTLGPGLNPA